MELREAFHRVRELINTGELSEAEQLLTSVARDTSTYQGWAGSFINTLVYSILLPQKRFFEAYAWLDDSISADLGFESWNSVSNLGHLMIKIGDTKTAELMFNAVLEARTGPEDEAYEFLEMIKNGSVQDLVEVKEDPRTTKAYGVIHNYMKNNLDDLRSTFEEFDVSRGDATASFVSGAISEERAQSLGITSDVVARALWDIATEAGLDPLPSYEEAVAAAQMGDSDKNHRRVLRLLALQGSGEAAYYLSESLRKSGNLNFVGWLNVSRARGFVPAGQEQVIGLEQLEGRAEFVHFITSWMNAEPAEETEGMWASISRRAMWIFPDDYVLSVGANYDPVLYHIQEKLNSSMEIPVQGANPADFKFHEYVNGWSYQGVSGEFADGEEIVALIDLVSKSHGEPKLVLPWGDSWTHSIIDEGEDYFDWQEDEDDDEPNAYKLMFDVANAFVYGELHKASPWEVLTPSDEGFGMSEHSDFNKFLRFVDRLIEEKVVIVDLDQHCAACGASTYEDAVNRDPELEGKKIFRTWGQNSQYSWLGSGYIEFETIVEDPQVEKILKEMAYEEGLDLGIKAPGWVPTGNFGFDSGASLQN